MYPQSQGGTAKEVAVMDIIMQKAARGCLKS